MQDTTSAGNRIIPRSPTHSSVLPMESLLTQIFKPNLQTKEKDRPKPLKKKIVDKKPEIFVPFFNERNNMNQLILVNFHSFLLY